MSYKLIRGEFHIFYPHDSRRGPEPDGDTLKFLPDNPALVEDLHRPGSVGPRFNGAGMINLRFEGVDALETHFDGTHQNLDWASAARDAVLDRVGFGAIEFWDDLPYKVRRVEHHPRRGYILANTLDGHGRIVAFVFVGDPRSVDGGDVWLEVKHIEDSLNFMLLEQGLVYAAFYTTLPPDLKIRLAELTVVAREQNLGLWPHAVATVDRGTEIADLDKLQQLVVWPKLFRRLARYFGAGHLGLGGFDAWLRADPIDRDDRVLLPDGDFGHMHDLIDVIGDRIKMIHRTEDIVILPDDAVAPKVEPLKKERMVQIVAALANPAGPERGHETVTLLNRTPKALDLEGWEVADRSNDRHLLHGKLKAGVTEQVVLSKHVKLGNRGDTITLFNAEGRLVDQVSYTRKEAKREGWTMVF